MSGALRVCRARASTRQSAAADFRQEDDAELRCERAAEIEESGPLERGMILLRLSRCEDSRPGQGEWRRLHMVLDHLTNTSWKAVNGDSSASPEQSGAVHSGRSDVQGTRELRNQEQAVCCGLITVFPAVAYATSWRRLTHYC